VQDCYHDNYNGAPTDGSAWTAGDCKSGVVARGGGWLSVPVLVRSATRLWLTTDNRKYLLGFRVGRTLTPEPSRSRVWSGAP